MLKYERRCRRWKSRGKRHEAFIFAALHIRIDELGGRCWIVLLHFRKEGRLAQRQVSTFAQKVAAEPALSIDVIADPRQFAQMRAKWDRLVGKSSVEHPFMSHTWLTTWWDCFAEDSKLRIYVVKSGDDWIAAAPM